MSKFLNCVIYLHSSVPNDLDFSILAANNPENQQTFADPDVNIEAFFRIYGIDQPKTIDQATIVFYTDPVQHSMDTAGIPSSSAVVSSSALDQDQDIDMVISDRIHEVIVENHEPPRESSMGQQPQRQYQEMASQATDILNSTDEYHFEVPDSNETRRTLEVLSTSVKESLEALIQFASKRPEVEEKFGIVHHAFTTQRQGVRDFREMCVDSDERIQQDFERYVAELRQELDTARDECKIQSEEVIRLKSILDKQTSELLARDQEIRLLKEKINRPLAVPGPSRINFVKPQFTVPRKQLLQTPRAERFEES